MAEISILITVQHGSTKIEHILKSGKRDQADIPEEVSRLAGECGAEAAAICAGAFRMESS